jgi:hypothetical protein
MPEITHITDIEEAQGGSFVFQTQVSQINAAAGNSKPATQPNPVQERPDRTLSEIASWGSDNLRPQNLIDALKPFPEIKEALRWKARALYSGGIRYGTISFDDDGNEIFTPVKDKSVEEFFRKSNINRYIMDAATDYYWFNNIFPLILMDETKKAYALQVRHSSFCRFGTQDKKGFINKVYENANWRSGATLENCKEYITIDPYYNAVQEAKSVSSNKFILPLSIASEEEIYYQTHPWHDLLQSDWLKLGEEIPRLKKAMLNNQMAIIYHIEIAGWYFSEAKYPGEWDKFTPEEKREKVNNEREQIEKTLTGAANAGKSIVSAKKLNATGTGDLSAVTVTVVDNKFKTGLYIEDSEEVLNRLYASIGVDPTLPGLKTGKGMGAGSGSDKGVAMNIYLLNCKAEQDLILEPLNLIRDLNGWNQEYVFMFNNYYIATKQHRQEVSKKINSPNN